LQDELKKIQLQKLTESNTEEAGAATKQALQLLYHCSNISIVLL